MYGAAASASADADGRPRAQNTGGGMLLATAGPYTPRMFSVPPEGGLIGRSRKCRISLLHDCEVSHNHAVIEPAQGGVLCIRDVGSTFGTYLNDKRLSEPKTHRGADCFVPFTCGPTEARWSYTAGPGEHGSPASAACSCETKTFSCVSRVPLPKP